MLSKTKVLETVGIDSRSRTLLGLQKVDANRIKSALQKVSIKSRRAGMKGIRKIKLVLTIQH